MKKVVLTLIVICTLVSIIPINASADDKDMLTDVLKTVNQGVIGQRVDESIFDDSMENLELDKYPLLMIYPATLGSYGETDFSTVVNKAQAKKTIEFLAIKDEPYVMTTYYYGEKFGVREQYDIAPKYIQDILDGESKQVFCGEEANISNVTGYIRRRVRDEMAMVYETDKGVFVRYYEDEKASAVEFRWDEYIRESIEYYEYSTSYENNYAPDGQPLYGAGISFLEWRENPPQDKGGSLKTDQVIIIVAIGASLLVTATVAAAVAYRRKKR